MPVRTHTFNGRRYKIDVDPCILSGNCTQYKAERYITVLEHLDTRKGLITTLHESLHACDWKEDEGRIDQISKDIGTFLWRLGYRCTKKA